MKKSTLALAVATLAVGVAGTWSAVTQQSKAAASGSTASLEARIAELEKKVVLVQDVQDIYNLQNAYGYYLDRSLFDDVSDLFADDAVVEINARGVYKGKNVRNLFKGAMGEGENGLRFGRVNTHMQLQGVVHVDPDGKNAKGRWRSFAMLGSAGRNGKPGFGMWSEGVYEITYRKYNGRWMFQTMRWDPMLNAEFHQGWDRPLTAQEESLVPGATPVAAAAPAGSPGAAGQASVVQGANLNQRFPPDAPPTRRIKPFPEIEVLPFHYPNPVTGKPTVIPEPRP
ncbi:MAG: nuclear transport factor 2 family protein [Steroidobacteraceae bacterium]